MALFDFECKQCHRKFSELVKGAEKIHCPWCRSQNIKKLFGTFSTISEATKLETHASDLPSISELKRYQKYGRYKSRPPEIAH